MNKKPKIYLAGKITNDWWRGNILDNEPGEFDRTRGISLDYPDFDTFYDSEEEFDKFIITGPHSISCDHGCFHRSKHASSNHFEEGWEDGGLVKGDVMMSCMHQIDKSDMIFAYINHDELYGTIAEIGYAFANDKFIFIVFANDELYYKYWFINEMSTNSCVITNPQDLKKFFNKMIQKTRYESTNNKFHYIF